MAASTPPSAPTRDPWRATPSSTAVGDGNGNGHDIANGQADVPAPDAEAQKTGSGLFRRR
jgi:hypothetical protein